MERYNLDQAYAKIGSGRMQWMLIFVTSIFRNSGNYVYYTFGYLILEQKFVCSWEGGDFSTCKNEDICLAQESGDIDFVYRVDESYKYYFNNWFTEMNLVCIPKSKIGLMITVYYIAFAAGGAMFTLPETIGRKKSVMFSAFMSLIAQTTILCSRNLIVRTLCFALMGLS